MSDCWYLKGEIAATPLTKNFTGSPFAPGNNEGELSTALKAIFFVNKNRNLKREVRNIISEFSISTDLC